MPCLFEYLRRHVPRGAACRGEHMELFLVHYPRQSKVRNQQVRIIFGRAEQEVLRLQISVDNSMVVEVCNGRKGCANEVSGIRFIVATLTANSVEELASQGQISD